jgi:hypothetical protein
MTGHHLDDLRQRATEQASRRRGAESGPVDVAGDPPAGVTLEAIALVRGELRWRDASPEACRLARTWGDRPPASEPSPRRRSR